MLLFSTGETFKFHDITYRIGDSILAVSGSEYEGLYGVIVQIRDGDDKDTENEGPEIYCSFKPPLDPNAIAKLEQNFSALYCYPKKLKDISLDFVVMSPDEIEHCIPG